MLAIGFRFPAGRYHATPWAHHVNEGAIEWPPSPWRLLRALLAVWHRKACADVEEATLERLVTKLAECAPSYRLPQAVASHTRHYVPLYKDKTTKIFDTFVDLRRKELLVAMWPEAVIDGSELDALDILLDRLGYLGRAESWVDACRLDSPPLPNTRPIAALADLPTADRPPGERLRLLAPMATIPYEEWRRATLDQHLTRKLADKKRKAAEKGKRTDAIMVSKREQQQIAAGLPSSVFVALSAETADLRKAGWSQAPGSEWIEYERPVGVLTSRPGGLRPPERRSPTMARFALAGSVLPRLTECVSVADRMRKALMSRSDAAAVFSGRDDDGVRLSGHRHAFVLLEANGRGGEITHVSLYAAMGFDDTSRRALESLKGVWGRGGHDTQVILSGVGEPEDFAGTKVVAGQCALVDSANVWESRTPFVPTRHPKCFRDGRPKLDEHGRHVGSPEHDLCRLLAEGGVPQPDLIEPLATTMLGGKQVRWLEFHTDRKNGGGLRAARVGCGFRLHFSEPVRGPIALGYGAHFGLGVFAPEGVY